MSKERENLNKLYYPLYMKAMEIYSRFQTSGFEAEIGWYSGHYSRDESGEYSMDYFPIPVVGVKGVCDIETGFDRITVSAKLNRREALEYPFEELKGMTFEVYGVEDYLADYYNSETTLEQLRENIRNSKEREIGFSFVFDGGADADGIFKLVKLLRRKGFYY
ncbi:MAG: hypothetical protein NC394_08070 [Bacteroides sp.]|nr:hypothetical protein [Bacteroides sp.]